MSFDPVSVITGAAVPLLAPNIDTDVIIRVERMTSTSPADLAPWAFEALRYRADGDLDPTCVLNQPAYAGAPILLAGSNFGCGSSREPAVWAVAGLGIRCVIAPSFGDIFKVNCQQNGVLAITLPEPDVTAIAELSSGGSAVSIDLSEQRIVTAGHEWRFEIAAMAKHSLLAGLDDLELTLRDVGLVTEWEATDRRDRPWAWQRLGHPQPR